MQREPRVVLEQHLRFPIERVQLMLVRCRQIALRQSIAQETQRTAPLHSQAKNHNRFATKLFNVHRGSDASQAPVRANIAWYFR